MLLCEFEFFQVAKWPIVVNSYKVSIILHIASHEQMEIEHMFTICYVSYYGICLTFYYIRRRCMLKQYPRMLSYH